MEKKIKKENSDEVKTNKKLERLKQKLEEQRIILEKILKKFEKN